MLIFAATNPTISMTQEIIDYRKYVKYLSDNDENRIFLNSDEQKAIAVFSALFTKAQTSIKIFAGCLSNSVSNSSDYIDAIGDFVHRGGSVQILLNKYDEENALKSDLLKRLAFYQTKGLHVQIKCCNDKPYFENDPEEKEIHFTECDNHSYRIETDIENRKSICNMNDEEMAKKLSDFFDGIFNRSIDIDLISLFKMK